MLKKWIVASLVLFGCNHQTPAPQAAAKPEPVAIEKTLACSVDTDCGNKQLCVDNQCVNISAGLAQCSQLKVHFEFNSADLSTDEHPHLDRVARCLKADPTFHVTIEGNADERGTEEYNLALGQRRARSVEKYLQVTGVTDAQLRTISYGKENPLCNDHTEACWAENRRASVKTQAASR